MNTGLKLLVVNGHAGQTHALCERLAARGITPQVWEPTAALPPEAEQPKADAAIVVGSGFVAEPMGETMQRLAAQEVPTLVWGAQPESGATKSRFVEQLDESVGVDEVVGRLATLSRYIPLVRRLERELEHIHRLGAQLNRYFSEIDQEMRLAGRLQQDFLPTRMPEIPGMRVASVYRPASWVSGDMFDVFRVDERHVGMFIADAMGHGVAAGLLTMFLRQALSPKMITGSTYRVVGPAEAMACLNDTLMRQRLPNCQFVTAVYALYDLETRELRVARGGHPYPLHARTSGAVEPICATGTLLGLPDVPAEFDEVSVTLAPGDKLVLFTDGLEDDFFVRHTQHSEGECITPELREWLSGGIDSFVEALGVHLDGKAGSLNPPDDITLLAIEVE